VDACGSYFIEDLERLGQGGFGEVYKVNVYNSDRSYATQYARKYFSPAAEYEVTAVREIADLRQRFLVEIKTQYTLNSINYNLIAPIVLFKTTGDKPYFIMELAECNLRKMIDNGMDIAEKRVAVIQILQGVKLIHDNNYIHRDLKPENILRYANGWYKISDFGLVKDLDDLRAAIKTKFNPQGMGSGTYRAPEIIDFGKFSVQSDIYALGRIISDIYSSAIPSRLRPVINKATSYLVEDRYLTVDKLLEDFCSATHVTAEAS
jgi:serine/threonine protein kinase